MHLAGSRFRRGRSRRRRRRSVDRFDFRGNFLRLEAPELVSRDLVGFSDGRRSASVGRSLARGEVFVEGEPADVQNGSDLLRRLV
jgi:hypothetical protein